MSLPSPTSSQPPSPADSTDEDQTPVIPRLLDGLDDDMRRYPGTAAVLDEVDAIEDEVRLMAASLPLGGAVREYWHVLWEPTRDLRRVARVKRRCTDGHCLVAHPNPDVPAQRVTPQSLQLMRARYLVVAQRFETEQPQSPAPESDLFGSG